MTSISIEKLLPKYLTRNRYRNRIIQDLKDSAKSELREYWKSNNLYRFENQGNYVKKQMKAIGEDEFIRRANAIILEEEIERRDAELVLQRIARNRELLGQRMREELLTVYDPDIEELLHVQGLSPDAIEEIQHLGERRHRYEERERAALNILGEIGRGVYRKKLKRKKTKKRKNNKNRKKNKTKIKCVKKLK